MRLFPWVVCVGLAILVLVEWRRADRADTRLANVREACFEIVKLKDESNAGHAKWLTLALREIRAGDETLGLRSLDRLLHVLAASIPRDGPEAEIRRTAMAYLEELGDPSLREFVDEPR